MSTPAHLILTSVEIDKEEIRRLFHSQHSQIKEINLEMKIGVRSFGDVSEYFTGYMPDPWKIGEAIIQGKLKIHAEKTEL